MLSGGSRGDDKEDIPLPSNTAYLALGEYHSLYCAHHNRDTIEGAEFFYFFSIRYRYSTPSVCRHPLCFVISFLVVLLYFYGLHKTLYSSLERYREDSSTGSFLFLLCFQGQSNPFTASEEEKFNVLQKISYGAVMFILVPVIIITGILFDNILSFSQVINAIGGLRILDVIHVITGYLLVLFLVIHMYMATLGKTVTSYLKSMITGE